MLSYLRCITMNKVALALTYAGLLPFIVCAFCLAGEVSQLPFLGETRQILATYSLIIISFAIIFVRKAYGHITGIKGCGRITYDHRQSQWQ